MKRGASYARLSDVRKGDTDGIERQLRENRAHAERLDVEILEELVDNDVTASKKKRRAAFERLMAGIEANEWDVVVLRSLERWVRRPDELERIIECVEKSTVQIDAIHGEVDLRTRQGRMAARILTSVAMHEVEAIQERVTDWHLDRAQRGLPLHGPAGYGFGPDKVSHDPEQAERIREAARRVLDGDPLRTICREWNEAGVPAPGVDWRSPTLRRILLAPRTAGLRVHKGQVVGPATWEPILDRQTWDRLGALLRNPSRRTAVSRDPHLLTGIASCGKCERGLNHKMMSGARRYFCRFCFGTTVYAEHLERHVVEKLVEVVDLPADLEDAEPAEPLLDQIADLERDLDVLAAEVGDGRITMGEWKIAREGVTGRLEAARAKLRTADRSGRWQGTGAELASGWDGMSRSHQRTILSDYIDDIRVLPAIAGVNRFDARRARITWRR